MTQNIYQQINFKLISFNQLINLQSYCMQKSALIIVGLLLLTAMGLFNVSPSTESGQVYKAKFEEWKQQFSKNYNSQFEEKYRFKLFYENLLMINEHNAKYESGEELSFLRLNFFSDLTSDEINKAYFAQQPLKSASNFNCTGPQYPKKDKFEANFTLDSKMIGTEVYDQKYNQCKSGYAFATAAAVESLMYKIFKTLVPLSAQQLVDCTKQTGNTGCTGGTPLNALHYLMNRGAMKNTEYTYAGKTQDCQYTAAKKIFELESCTKVDSNLVMLKSQILNQPVIVSFDATGKNFLSYGGGLYDPAKSCGTIINHYMLAVGWGQITTGVSIYKKTTYYIVVKNSMGMKWGENGYGKIIVQVDKDATSGCGLLKEIYFPYE